MEVITERVRIREVAARWRAQYPKSRENKWEKLKALDIETATADEVEAIIGNRSWTRLEECSDCKATDLPLVVQVGNAPDYESNTAWLCIGCIKKALALTKRELSTSGKTAAI